MWVVESEVGPKGATKTAGGTVFEITRDTEVTVPGSYVINSDGLPLFIKSLSARYG